MMEVEVTFVHDLVPLLFIVTPVKSGIPRFLFKVDGIELAEGRDPVECVAFIEALIKEAKKVKVEVERENEASGIKYGNVALKMKAKKGQKKKKEFDLKAELISSGFCRINDDESGSDSDSFYTPPSSFHEEEDHVDGSGSGNGKKPEHNQIVFHRDPTARRIRLIDKMSELTNLTPDSISALNSAGIYRATKIQSAMLPSIDGGISTVAVGPEKSGKTYGYGIPLIDSAADYDDGSKIVILTTGSESVRSIRKDLSQISRRMGLKNGIRIKSADCKSENFEILTEIVNGFEILVTTPNCLIRLATEHKSVDLAEVKWIVFERCADLFERFAAEIRKIMQISQLRRRRKNDGIWNFVAVSQTWSRSIEQFVSRYWSDSGSKIRPSFIFTSLLEAALYSKVKTEAHFVKQDNQKLTQIDKIMEGKISNERILIVCSDAESCLKVKGHLKGRCHVFHEDKNFTYDKENVLKIWKNYQKFSAREKMILILSDKIVLEELFNADVLIHFDLPIKSKKLFASRFGYLKVKFRSFYSDDEEESAGENHLIMGPRDEDKLRTLMLFLRKSGAEIPVELEDLFLRHEAELAKVKIERSICDEFKSRGECGKMWRCERRHFMNPDLDPVNRQLLGKTDQKLVFRVTETLSPVHFMAQEVNEVHCHFEVVLLGVRPKDKEENWNSDLSGEIRRILNESGIVCLGLIERVAGNVVWMKEVLVKTFVAETWFISTHLRKHLLKSGHAEENPGHLDKILKAVAMFKDYYQVEDESEFEPIVDYASKEIEEEEDRDQVKSEQIWEILNDFEPQINELKSEESVLVTEVFSPRYFFVRLNADFLALVALEEKIRGFVQTELSNVNHGVGLKLRIGDICLAEMRNGIEGEERNPDFFARAKIIGIDDERIEITVFFVDYGCIEIVTEDRLMRILPEFITSVPFQAILCGFANLRPVDGSEADFGKESGDLLYEMSLHKNKPMIFEAMVHKTSAEKSDLTLQFSYEIDLLERNHEGELLSLADILVTRKLAAYIDLDDSRFGSEFADEVVKSALEKVEKVANEKKADESKVQIFGLENLWIKAENPGMPSLSLTTLKAPNIQRIFPDVLWSQTEATIKLSVVLTSMMTVNPKHFLNVTKDKVKMQFLLVELNPRSNEERFRIADIPELTLTQRVLADRTEAKFCANNNFNIKLTKFDPEQQPDSAWQNRRPFQQEFNWLKFSFEDREEEIKEEKMRRLLRRTKNVEVPDLGLDILERALPFDEDDLEDDLEDDDDGKSDGTGDDADRVYDAAKFDEY